MADQSQYITKYIEEKYFEATKLGLLKIGTLREYRSYEDSAESRL